MKINLIDHGTFEVVPESVSDHLFITQFHKADVKVLMPRPFEHNACILQVKVHEEKEEEIVTPVEKNQDEKQNEVY